MSDVSAKRYVSTPAQVRLLCSPLRHELVDTLYVLGGEADVATLAEQLGCPADGLYYHLRALSAGGLIQEVPAVAGGERRYRLAGNGAEPLRLAYDLGPNGNASELRSFLKGLLQIASREFKNALTNSKVVVDGAQRELWASRNKGWLSSADLAEVNVLLERLSELTSQTKAEGRQHLASLAFVLAPVDARPKRREQRQVEATEPQQPRSF